MVPPINKMKNKKIFEIVFVLIVGLTILGICIPSIITNVKKARIDASYLAAKAYYEEYLSYYQIEHLEEGQVIYYNDGHQYWLIDSQGNILVDEDKNPMTLIEEKK